ncbi:type II CAAX prenyl endopeptidase Rce1 family protein [Endozoicomonas sp. ALD040]|uniref:CPBP family glutamic-type intramembrane protease n=1 Tax=Endozoicomonas sp. ALD040 TaxID=3403079 RepID=UPI003BAEF4CF
MKKYTLIIAICCSLVTQYAKSAPLPKNEDELSTLHALVNMTLTDSVTIEDKESNITVVLTKSDAPLLKTEDELSTLHAVTNMSLTDSDSDSDSVNTEDKEPYKIVGFIKRYNIDKQIYYGLLLGAIHVTQYRILYFCILRPLSLVHDPYDGKLTFVEAVTGAIIEEAIFNGLLLPLINYSIELATNSSTKFDEKIFTLSDNHHDKKIFIMSNIIKSTAFGLLHLANKNPLMAQVLISMINSFVRGQFTKHYGLLSATVAHVTLNSMGYLVYIYSGREHF